MRRAITKVAALVLVGAYCALAGRDFEQVPVAASGRALLDDTAQGICVPATGADPATKAPVCTVLTGCKCDTGYKLLPSGGPVVALRCFKCPAGQNPYSFPPNGKVMCVSSSQCPNGWGFTKAYCWNPVDKFVGAFIQDQSNEQCNGFLNRFACTIPLCPYRCPPTQHACCRSCIAPGKACTLFCVAPTCGCSCGPQPIG